MIFKGVLSSTLSGVRRKPGKFSLVIDDQVQFEFIEPAQCTFSSKFLEGFMLLFSFDMTASNGCRINKRNTSALSQRFRFKEDSRRYTNLSLEFYEAVVRHTMWKILLHLCSNKEIEML